MIKVLLADDQELIRQSLSFVMSKQEDIEMVGTAANGCEALELVEEKQPDVVLLDIRMPEMDGVECTRRIKQEFPGIKVIILTTFDDDDYVFDALRYGASGYLLKGVSVDGLTNAVPREDIEQLLGKGSFYDLPDRLVDTADENGGPDNITALLLGVEGGDEVVLVPAGQGDEGVVVGEMLGGQQLLVRAVAV